MKRGVYIRKPKKGESIVRNGSLLICLTRVNHRHGQTLFVDQNSIVDGLWDIKIFYKVMLNIRRDELEEPEIKCVNQIWSMKFGFCPKRNGPLIHIILSGKCSSSSFVWTATLLLTFVCNIYQNIAMGYQHLKNCLWFCDILLITLLQYCHNKFLLSNFSDICLQLARLP